MTILKNLQHVLRIEEKHDRMCMCKHYKRRILRTKLKFLELNKILSCFFVQKYVCDNSKESTEAS